MSLPGHGISVSRMRPGPVEISVPAIFLPSRKAPPIKGPCKIPFRKLICELHCGIFFMMIIQFFLGRLRTEIRAKKRFLKWKVKVKEGLDSEKLIENLTLDEVAESLGMMRDELNLVCKKTYGVHFLKVRNWKRVEESVRFIEQHPEISAEEVGALCGFTERRNFERNFKSRTGITPSRYRMKILHGRISDELAQEHLPSAPPPLPPDRRLMRGDSIPR